MSGSRNPIERIDGQKRPIDVLIVDDHCCTDGASILVLLLGLWGFTARVVRRLSEAVREAKATLPRLIIIDTDSSERVLELHDCCHPPLVTSLWLFRACRF